MKKEKYESPEMEIVQFEMEDVITTSDYCCDVYGVPIPSESGGVGGVD